ncbi:hypothetical protein ACTRXD_03535 [Nitrospira sp. T9]|uniref:hypothetical protein n=1 Tax=unclassified Nitrospira TaxID=2652172 RepID=UPI003F97F35F
MTSRNKIYPTDIFFGKGHREERIFQSTDFSRVKYYVDECCSKLVDIHKNHKLEIHFLQVSAEEGAGRITFSSSGRVLRVFSGNEFGILLKVEYEKKLFTVWLPSASVKCHFDKFQRMSAPEEPFLPWHWEVDTGIQLHLFLLGMPGEQANVPYVLIEDENGEFIETIKSLNTVEQCLYRKSDWFFANKPSDIWKYLINGSIYDPRGHKGMNKRYKCQQCAYTWWSYFGFLNRETGKKLYDVMQNVIAYSVLLDMSPKGEWGHGFWTDEMETHARFHLDGIHLLISQHEKTDESIWVEAAERGMTFVVGHLMEQLDDGNLWFLHDTTEFKDKRIHFQSTLFGKSSGNSLCINTHVQALTVLYRLRHVIPQNTIYAEMLEKGVNSLKRVLEHQPADALYKIFLFMWMKLRKKSRSKAEIVMHAVLTRGVKKALWAVRRQFPRLAYPGGWIDRDLTISCFSENYQVTNLKDFLTLYQQMRLTWLVPYIKNNFVVLRKFLLRLGLTNALDSSPYYIEFMDVLYMYDRSIEKIDPEEIKEAQKTIFRETGGYSVDCSASELVRGK